jgi:HEAT repeat protein
MLAQVFRDLNDPRAIPLLLGKNPERDILESYSEGLVYLQAGRKAHPLLVKLLSSKDPKVRSAATDALSESRDPDLVAPALKLLRDPSPEVRESALYLARSLRKGTRGPTYEASKALLADASKKVRLCCAVMFASDEDPVCGNALLALIRDEHLDADDHLDVVMAAEDLVGKDFGYHHGADLWQPTTENNKAAIAKFEQWIREQKDSGRKEK